jgi:hypothetical protein
MRVGLFSTRAIATTLAFACTCCCAETFAQQAGEKTQESAAQQEAELEELAKELEAAEAEERTDAEERATEARDSMSSYQARRRRQAIETRKRLLQNPAWKPTHKQVDRIELSAPLINMCLDSQGRILACCGDKKLRILSTEGQVLETRSLTFVPQAIAVRSSDGAVYVGGEGMLVRFSAAGELEQKASFPPPPTEEEKQAMVDRMIKQYEDQMKQMVLITKGLNEQLDKLNKQLAEAEDPPSEDEKKKIAAMSEEDLFATVSNAVMSDQGMEMSFRKDTSLAVQARVIEVYLKQLGAFDMAAQMKEMEAQIRQQAESAVGKATYTGLAVAADDLFVICSGPGYSYNAWRMTHDFAEPKMVIGALSGCCGQMDCQTHDGNLWLAMNTQHKVLCYDRDGKELSGFGKNDGEAADGFGGCCEPKNIRFSQDGKYIYCAQSGPPVCVKRFTLDGDFQDVVCYPIYETGCVRVSVDVAGDTFYMMSPNESSIYVFQPDAS